jgi:DNA-binding transcriptional regulator PaaX
MSRNSFSKKILALLADKPAVRVTELIEAIPAVTGQKYALQRSLKGLEEAGFISSYDSGRQTYTKITKEGKKKAHSIRLENDTTLVDPSWDGRWRVILLDLPEDRKTERDGLRYLLKKAGFVCLKNAVWISPLPYEYLFGNIKKDLGLTGEMMILTTDTLDTISEDIFLKSFAA